MNATAAAEKAMSEWVSIDQWKECTQMERPGIVFEIVNSDGQSLLTPCVGRLQTPWDWKSAPVQFRAILAPKPRHSTQIPPPASIPGRPE